MNERHSMIIVIKGTSRYHKLRWKVHFMTSYKQLLVDLTRRRGEGGLSVSLILHLFSKKFLKDMNINELERPSTFTLRYKLKYRNIVFIAVLHFTVTVRSLIIRITRTLKWVWNGHKWMNIFYLVLWFPISCPINLFFSLGILDSIVPFFSILTHSLLT